jgi:hypothetical protein
MAAEAQLEAMIATGLPLDMPDLTRLRDFLRNCRAEALELEEAASSPAPTLSRNGAIVR